MSELMTPTDLDAIEADARGTLCGPPYLSGGTARLRTVLAVPRLVAEIRAATRNSGGAPGHGCSVGRR